MSAAPEDQGSAVGERPGSLESLAAGERQGAGKLVRTGRACTARMGYALHVLSALACPICSCMSYLLLHVLSGLLHVLSARKPDPLFVNDRDRSRDCHASENNPVAETGSFFLCVYRKEYKLEVYADTKKWQKNESRNDWRDSAARSRRRQCRKTRVPRQASSCVNFKTV